MSYRPSVRDDSRATPYFYQRGVPPIKTHRSSYFDIAQSSLVSRKLGNYKPFWAKGLDFAGKVNKRYNKFTKTFPFMKKRYIIPNSFTWYGKTPQRRIPIDKVYRGRTGSFRDCRTAIFYNGRWHRQCHVRPNRSNRYRYPSRKQDQALRYKSRFRKSYKY